MAKVKTVKGWSTSSGANSVCNLSTNNNGAIIDPSGDYIVLGDVVMDAQTLHPVQGKSTDVALGNAKGYQRSPARMALLTPRPVAFTNHNSGVSEGGFYNTATYMNKYAIAGYRNNLDKAGRQQGGSVYKFQDSAGVDHIIASTLWDRDAYTRYSYLRLIEGDSIVDAENVIGFRESDSHPNNTTYLAAQTIDVVHVDVANQVIYLYATFARPSTTYHYLSYQDMYKVSFTTNAVDGSLSVGNPTRCSVMQGAFTGGGTFGEFQQRFFCGLNNAGKPCFLSIYENKYSLNSSGLSTNYYNSDPYSGVSNGYWRKVSGGSWNDTTFDIYDLGGDSHTRVYDAGLTTGTDGQRWNGHMCPSHFEPSPIAGETDVYYGYYPIFTTDTSVVKVMQMKWDKAADTFEQNVLSLDIATWWRDSFPEHAAVVSEGWKRYSCSKIQAILTNDGAGGYFLSLVQEHTLPDALTDAPSISKNLVTFELDPTDMSTLSYHSSISLAALSLVSANENNTKLYAIESGSAKVLQWQSTGWAVIFNSSGTYYGLGEDESGALWGVSANAGDFINTGVTPFALNGNQQECALTLEYLSPDLPNSVSVEFVDATIAYAGQELTKNLKVNAYDVSGNRLSKDCVLKISSSNAVFTSNTARTLNVTTSDTVDTLVSLTIDGAGYINVSASFTI